MIIIPIIQVPVKALFRIKLIQERSAYTVFARTPKPFDEVDTKILQHYTSKIAEYKFATQGYVIQTLSVR